jgi:hypothetical protein
MTAYDRLEKARTELELAEKAFDNAGSTVSAKRYNELHSDMKMKQGAFEEAFAAYYGCSTGAC